MKYLVLGSAGQLGLSLCEYLEQQGHEVERFDIADGAEFDLRIYKSSTLRSAVNRADFVFFLAWDVGGSTYLARYQDTYQFVTNNLQIMSNVFDALWLYQKPFIFASSQMASMSYSSYGLTKSLAEKITETLGGLTVKFWNVYGVEHDPEKTHVITDFIEMARDQRRIEMRTTGEEVRQMLHADDCSRALYTLSQRYPDLPRDRDYHITNFEWTPVMRIAAIIANHYPGTMIVPSPNKDTVQKDARNEPDPYILQYWKPEISLEHGIERIIKSMETSR